MPDPAIRLSTRNSLLFPIVCLVVLLGVGAVILVVERQIVMPRIAPILEAGSLSDAQRTAIDYISQLGELMISWSVAILGAIALSARSILGERGLFRWVSGGALALSFLACILSIWLGMVVVDIIIESLTLEQDPIKNVALHLCRRWQYVFFILALVFFVFSWLNAVVHASPRKTENEARATTREEVRQ